MERLSTTAVSHLHSEETAAVETTTHGQHQHQQAEVAQIEHFAEQLVDHMAKDQQHQGSHHGHHNAAANSDQAFHPITTEGLQVCKSVMNMNMN